jgi:hypothetical protein
MTMTTDSSQPTVEFLVRPDSDQLGYAYTRGLWQLGIPELVITVPPEMPILGPHEQGVLATLLGRGLVDLGFKLIAADGFAVAPFDGEFAGRPVRIWLGRPEPVDGVLAIALGDEVDTMLPGRVSLWDDDPPAGSTRL